LSRAIAPFDHTFLAIALFWRLRFSGDRTFWTIAPVDCTGRLRFSTEVCGSFTYPRFSQLHFVA
jgi:hypothetical protein